MQFTILPILFLSVGLSLHDPVSLLANLMLFLWVTALFIFTKKNKWKKHNLYYLYFAIPLLSFISSISTGQSPINMLTGYYQRNFGLLTILGLCFLSVYIMAFNLELKNAIKFGFLPLVLLSNVYGYLQFFNLDPLPWKNPYKAVTLTLGNPNYSGALFGINSIIIVAKIFDSKSNYKKISWFILYLSNFFLSLQTDSIQAQVLIITGCLTFMVLKNFPFKKLKKFKFRSVYLAIIWLSPLFLVIVFLSNSSLKNLFYQQANVSQRLDYWRTGYLIWRDNLFFGVGLDNYVSYANFYKTKKQILRDGNSLVPDKSHNFFIDTFANSGLFTGILWVVLYTSIFYFIYKLIKIESQEIDSEICLLAGIWVAYFIQSLISPSNIILFVIGHIIAGLITSRYLSYNYKSEKSEMQINSVVLSRIIPSIILFVGILFSVKLISVNYQVNKIINSQISDPNKIIATVSAIPNARTTELIGVKLINDGFDCQHVIKVADLLIRYDNRSSQGWYMKTICSAKEGKYLEAIEHIDKALEFYPLSPQYLEAKSKLIVFIDQLSQVN